MSTPTKGKVLSFPSLYREAVTESADRAGVLTRPTASIATFTDAAERLAEALRFERAADLQTARERYEAIRASHESPLAVQIEATCRLAHVARLEGAWEEAVAFAGETNQRAKEAGLPDLAADALNIEAIVARERGDLRRAERLWTAMRAIAVAPRHRALAALNLAIAAADDARFADAETLFTTARRWFERAEDLRGEALVTTNLSQLALDKGRPERAVELLEPNADVVRRGDDLDILAGALLILGHARLQLGDADGAERAVREAYGFYAAPNEMSGRARNPVRTVRALRVLGEIAEQRGNVAEAYACLAHAQRAAASEQLVSEQREITALMSALLSPTRRAASDTH